MSTRDLEWYSMQQAAEIDRLRAACHQHNTERLAAENRVEALEEQRDGLLDQADRLRAELSAAKFATAHAKYEGRDDADAAVGSQRPGRHRRRADVNTNEYRMHLEGQKLHERLTECEEGREFDRAEVSHSRDTIDRLRAELAIMVDNHALATAAFSDAYDAIARVRELCEPDANGKALSHISRTDILRAIEGEQA